MKKLLAILLIGGLLFGLMGCQSTAQKQANMTFTNGESKDDGKEAGIALNYEAQYVRTNGYHDGAKFPKVSIIHSLQDLKDYYTTYHEIYDLEREETVYTDTTVGFLDACDRYDEAFFEEGFLVLVLLEEGSGSIRHEVQRVEQLASKKLSVSISRDVPEVGTSDMAEWHIILELNRDAMVETPNDVLVYLDGRLAFDGVAVEPPACTEDPAFFKEPPKGMLYTPEGEAKLVTAGRNWTYDNPDGTATTVIGDQAEKPMPQSSLQPVYISSKHAETIYLPVPGTGVYEPTDGLGYLVKLSWESMPSSVTCTCWPDTVWQGSGITGEKVPVDLNGPFYAKQGNYIYEFAATWEDTGAGYHGRANYYVYICGGVEHSHQVAEKPQTVTDPITGYCGNTQTTLYIGEKSYTFMADNSVTLTNILVNLDYDPNRVCRCRPEYTVDTEFGAGYGINLSNGYARCEKGQADLTQEQIDRITQIIEWAKTTEG